MRPKLVIRSEQMHALGASAERAFELRLRHHLAALPDRRLPEQHLARQLPLIVASGKRFFTTEIDLARYAEIVVLHLGGWKGDDHPEKAVRLLQARALPPARRLDNFFIWATSGGGNGRRHVRK